MLYVSFGSGSKGNCSLITDGNTSLLIDCGISLRRAKRSLSAIGYELNSLKYVLITHLHSDHFQYFNTWYKNSSLIFFTHSLVLNHVRALTNDKNACKRIFPFEPGVEYKLESMLIVPFMLNHDAEETVGIELYADGKSLAYATDLGSYGMEQIRRFEGKNMLFLEANHEVDLLLNSSYPPHVKKRILSPRGHLSNQQTMALLRSLKHPPKHLILGHLSENNNSPSIVKERIVEFEIDSLVEHFSIAYQNNILRVSF